MLTNIRSAILATSFVAMTMSSAASAMTGPKELISAKGAPESACRLITRSQEGLSVCSGTLIEPNQIITASHCLMGLTKPRITAECGVIGVEPSVAKMKSELSISGNAFFTTGVYFRESAVVTSYSNDAAIDQSILKLDHSMTLKPMKKAEKIDDAFLSGTECSMAGFGLDKNLSGGRPLIGRIPLFEFDEGGLTITSEVESTLSLARGYIEKPDELRALISTSVASTMSSPIGTPGDSGAGIYCRMATGEPFLVAVVSTITPVQDQTPPTAVRSKSTMNLWLYQMRANFLK